MISVVFEERLLPFYERFGFYTGMLCGQMETRSRFFGCYKMAANCWKHRACHSEPKAKNLGSFAALETVLKLKNNLEILKSGMRYYEIKLFAVKNGASGSYLPRNTPQSG